jgi:putative membrane protein
MKKPIITALLGLGGLVAKAQIPQPDPDTTARHFIIVASINNLQEVSAGQLAVQKAKNADVVAFGQMMVKDHGAAEQQLMRLAKRKGYDIPPEATGGIQPDLNLKNATNNFDALFIHAMLAGHGNTVQVFENYATTGKDPDVRAFALQTLPTLKAHLADIKAINEKYKNLAAK